MSLGQSLQQRQLQRLSPQQIQLMKLLQIPTAQIEQRVKEELEENPALEMNADLLEGDMENRWKKCRMIYCKAVWRKKKPFR